jgi:deoxyribose-phosphate aldolase
MDRMQEITTEETQALIAAVDYSEALTITATQDEVRAACAHAEEYGFRSVAVFPHHLDLVVQELKATETLAMIVVGFPCGGNTTHVKCQEAEDGLKRGATDLDMVMNLGAFKSGNYRQVSRDIEEVLSVARPFKVPCKVIVEVGILSEEEKVTAAKLVADSGAAFIKTCSGFGPGRATLHDIMLFKKAVGDRIGIKASGGVTSIEDGVTFMRAGAAVVAMRRSIVDQLQSIKWKPSR